MEFLHRNPNPGSPRLTLILLDWSCRESFHALRHLNRQTVDRDRYEIIWVEYYDRRAPEVRRMIDEAVAKGLRPPVDQWIVMDVPSDVYYHKHLMYNVGIVASHGELVTICDSDAIFSRTFVESILESFERDPNLALHHDQVRNNDRRFYPFNDPSIEEVIGPGAVNYANGTTTGLLDTKDPIHSRNYGACFSAWRKDLVEIGGADEHDHFVGHVCGPYDLTFRLVNKGRKEAWHEKELIYHVWHPGQAGAMNYLGPHDGRHVSTTSLAVRETGRVLPLVENPAIRLLRTGKAEFGNPLLLDLVVPERDFPRWTNETLEKSGHRLGPGNAVPSWAEPVLMEPGYRGYNIVQYDRYYGIELGDGPFDPARVGRDGYLASTSGDSVEEVRAKIDALPPRPRRYSPRWWVRRLRRFLRSRVGPAAR